MAKYKKINLTKEEKVEIAQRITSRKGLREFIGRRVQALWVAPSSKSVYSPLPLLEEQLKLMHNDTFWGTDPVLEDKSIAELQARLDGNYRIERVESKN
jgi:hypothetical protein